jgi:hypothetical protein
MLDAISAESLKLTSHKSIWLLVWIYPITIATMLLLTIGWRLASEHRPGTQNLDAWIATTASVWAAPGETLVRLLMAAFVAVGFAGEYGWNTWKLIVPHRSRTALIAAKYIVIVALFAISFTLAAAISILGRGVEAALVRGMAPQGISAALILEAHGKGALAAFAPTLLTIGYASLAAVLTRSTLAALVVTIVTISAEQILFKSGPFLYLKAPDLIWFLAHVSPGYHLSNLAHWISHGAALETPFLGGGVLALGWGVSLATLAGWIGGLIIVTTKSFERQDIN